jgi:hypothetical protein
MMSPKSLSFINYLKQVSGINFGNNYGGQKSFMNKTMNNFGARGPPANSNVLESAVNFYI